jgi:hypothetical protein
MGVRVRVRAWVGGCVRACVRGWVGACVRACVGGWVRACVRGWVGGWVRGWVGGRGGARVQGGGAKSETDSGEAKTADGKVGFCTLVQEFGACRPPLCACDSQLQGDGVLRSPTYPTRMLPSSAAVA